MEILLWLSDDERRREGKGRLVPYVNREKRCQYNKQSKLVSKEMAGSGEAPSFLFKIQESYAERKFDLRAT